jgi:multiple sugar transport system substrate-binding protein
VLDHPHLGDALAAGCIRPLDELFSESELETWAGASVGPSAESYRLNGRRWALPLDAATQVSARRPDLVPQAPTSWQDALELADEGLVAPSIAGPHAFLSFCSIAVSLGEEPATYPEQLVSRRVGRATLELLEHFARSAPAGVLDLNPIGMLERMASSDDLGYIPLVYGYVNYASADRTHPVAFGAPPTAGARIGSTIGGTGIAITRRSEPTPALIDHLRWLMSPEAQAEFIPRHEGQPSARSAWEDHDLNAGTGSFYSATLDTIEQSWVRPRFAGYVPFQSAASAIIRQAVAGGAAHDRALDEVDGLYRAAARTSKERQSA